MTKKNLENLTTALDALLSRGVSPDVAAQLVFGEAKATPKKPAKKDAPPVKAEKPSPKKATARKKSAAPKSEVGQIREHGREKYGVLSGDAIPVELKPIVEALVKGGEKPEVRGSWIWVTSPKPAKGLKKGDKDVPPRQALLWELGFRYSAKSAQWYYAPRKKSTAE